ncbi:hypothetical protein ILFOPFJJ_04767 [Ensifer psoraleae]|uniref:hypothetical protein n=1 Tax=Sinorhizobium psoraleae TaxID=520838 RepID=UPI0015693066|nr:hypothetical protein [Sinorhizobium psoraleae]NRP73850.1 hypothetical protein [Sinorhizobium psoraleae]
MEDYSLDERVHRTCAAVRIELETGSLVKIYISGQLDIHELVPPQKVGLIPDVSIPVASQVLIQEITAATRASSEALTRLMEIEHGID